VAAGKALAAAGKALAAAGRALADAGKGPMAVDMTPAVVG